jgi:AMIN domain
MRRTTVILTMSGALLAVVATGVGVAAAVPGPAAQVALAAGTAKDLPAPTRTDPQVADLTTGGGQLIRVRTGRHRDYDRVVFDIRGARPGWNVRYVPRLTQDGSGLPVAIRGSAVLQVALVGAPAHDEQGRPTLRTPRTLTPELPTLRQIRFAGDFEGVTTFGLGLRDRVGFRVFSLSNPTRVVVDVAHQPGIPFGTAPVRRAGTAPDVLVERVRTGRHPGFDRLVFDIRGKAQPTFSVRYAGGGSTIEVTFTGTGSPTSSPHASYSGPARIAVGLPALRTVTFKIVGAGVMRATVTTAHRHGFRVLTLSSPTRVVLDIAD